MSDRDNFMYDSDGNLTEDKYLQGEGSKNALVHFYCRTAAYCALRNSKSLKISYESNSFSKYQSIRYRGMFFILVSSR